MTMWTFGDSLLGDFVNELPMPHLEATRGGKRKPFVQRPLDLQPDDN
jgi:hypothetical protein